MFAMFVRLKQVSGAASTPNAAPGGGAGSGTRCQGATASAGDLTGDGGAHRYRRVSQRKAVGLGDVLDVVWYFAAAERLFCEGWCCRRGGSWA